MSSASSGMSSSEVSFAHEPTVQLSTLCKADSSPCDRLRPRRRSR
jgi:hypothetical protein